MLFRGKVTEREKKALEMISGGVKEKFE